METLLISRNIFETLAVVKHRVVPGGMSCLPLGLDWWHNWPGFSWQSWVPFVPSALPSAPGAPWHNGWYPRHLLDAGQDFPNSPLCNLQVPVLTGSWLAQSTAGPPCQLPHRPAFDSKAIFMPIPQKGAQTNNNGKGKNNKIVTDSVVVSSRS